MIKATDWARDLQSNIVVTAFTADEDADTSNLPVNDTSAFIFGGTAGKAYLLQFSYPVAEH